MILLQIRENEAEQRFDKYLKKLLKNAPPSFLYKMLRKKNIVLNGKKADGSERLVLGDEVKLFLSEDTYHKFSDVVGAQKRENVFENTKTYIQEYLYAYQSIGSLQIIYENDHILVVNKPSGVLSQKAKPSDTSLNEWIIGYLLAQQKLLPQSIITFKPSICNRLDRNTSGMVVCGKTLIGSQYVSSIIRDKSLQKYYYCVVTGNVDLDTRLQGYLYKDRVQNKVQIFQDIEEAPKAIQSKTTFIDTAFQTITIKNNVSLLEIQIFTGKPHQIRAHLASLGHPIIGDMKYGYVPMNQKFSSQDAPTLLLHCHKLIFPTTNDERFLNTSQLVLDCKAPQIFKRIIGEDWL